VPDVVFVISPRQDYPLRDLAAKLGYELELQGVPVTLHLGSFFPEPRPDRVYVLMGPREYVELEGAGALPGDAILNRTIFVGTEDPDMVGQDASTLALLRRGGAVFDVNQRTVLALHRQGIAARTLRLGYSAELDRFDPATSRPIDVMFYGRHSARRDRYLAEWTDVLARRNCLLRLADDSPQPGDTTSFLAEGRWASLAQTKVLVCLHREEQPYFDWPRAIDAIHVGAVVVSEHSSGIAPLEAGEHLLVGRADSLPFLVDALLRDEARLAHLREQAYKRLSEWLPAALGVAVLRAAIVELVGEPVPPGTPTGRHRVDGPLHEISRDSQRGGTSAEIRASPRERSAAGTLPVRIAFESPAWGARRSPRVTVTVAFDDQDTALLRTLRSLANSWLRDMEVVAVARGVDCNENGAAIRWLRRHPRLAALLVVQGVDSGLGAARNVGLDFARGHYYLALDAGQEVLPRCLAVLAGTLDATPDVTFLYAMQQITWEDAGFTYLRRDHLVNFLGWDPDRLGRENYIYAPALIRTNRLREVEGFCEGREFHGYEDYDLWRRMAARKWVGMQYPQLLVRRENAPVTSMPATMLSSDADGATQLGSA
jgi:hypothetical protein